MNTLIALVSDGYWEVFPKTIVIRPRHLAVFGGVWREATRFGSRVLHCATCIFDRDELGWCYKHETHREYDKTVKQRPPLWAKIQKRQQRLQMTTLYNSLRGAGQTFEYVGHSAVVHLVRTVEHVARQAETSRQVFRGLRLSRSGGARRSTPEHEPQGGRKSNVAAVGERGNDKAAAVAGELEGIDRSEVADLDSYAPVAGVSFRCGWSTAPCA